MAENTPLVPETEDPVGFEFGFANIKGGAPIGQMNDEMGTLGIVGFDAKDPTVLLGLTCAHVAFGHSVQATGPVLHPPKGSASEVLGTPHKNGMSSALPGALIDCATIRFTLGRPQTAGAIWSFPKMKVDSILPWGQVAIGTQVWKYGAATGKKTGFIVRDNLEWRSVDLNKTFSNQYKIKPEANNQFSDLGDSGSLIVAKTATGLAAVGIIIGLMAPDENGVVYSVASPIDKVLKKLGLKLF